jgi:P27 family predicted phage terminase small subunit
MSAKTPPPPPELAGAARARWLQIARELQKRGPVDVELLAAYCQLWARWRQAEDGIAKTSQLVRNSRGHTVPNPLIAIARDAAAQLRALEGRLGLDAAASSADAGPDASAAGELLTRRELAARLKVHMMTVTKWEQDGMPTAERGRKGKASKYRELEVRGWLAQRETQAKGGDPAASVAIERARKERAQAMESEQRYQMRAGKLLPADEVERRWGDDVKAIKARILACPAMIADRLARAFTLGGVTGLEAELEVAMHELLVDLADAERVITRTDT